MVYVGVDVAYRTHRIACLDQEGERLGASFTIEASQAGFERLQRKLLERGLRPQESLIGMEASGHYWENLWAFLEAKGWRLKLLNPFQVQRYREALAKKAKTDDIDAYVIAGLLRSGEARGGYVPDEEIQSLREIVPTRNTLMDHMKTYKRRALALIQLVFPELLELVKDPFARAVMALLKEYPTAAHIARLKPRQLERIARAFQGNNWSRSKTEAIIQAAQRSIYSGKAHQARGIVLRSLLAIIEQAQESIATLEAELEKSLKPPAQTGPSDLELLTAIPGVGAKTAAVLLAEIGDVQRFASAKQMISYFGLYPTIQESAGRRTALPRLVTRGPKHVRQALYMAAVAALKHNPELHTLYQRKRSQGKATKQALIAVAQKILALVYSLLRYRRSYDPRRVLLAFQGT